MGRWVNSAPPRPNSLSPQKRNMQLCVLHFFQNTAAMQQSAQEQPGAGQTCTVTARCLAPGRPGLCLLRCFVLLMSKMVDFFYANRWFLLTASHPLAHKHTRPGEHTQASALRFYEWVGCERLAEAAHWVTGSEPSFMTLGDVHSTSNNTYERHQPSSVQQDLSFSWHLTPFCLIKMLLFARPFFGYPKS